MANKSRLDRIFEDPILDAFMDRLGAIILFPVWCFAHLLHFIGRALRVVD